jgi:LPS O-antigen subunit length determinant protein (WzzB/FepE family)
MENYFSNKNLVDLILKWKVHLLIIAILAGIIGVVFSSSTFIKPKFKSFAVVYPDNLGEYSEESSTEQMLELLNSGDIRDILIKQFKLDEHYKVDPSYKYYLTTMHAKYADNFSFRKTENEAVKIEVLDTDPQMACDLVTGVIKAYHKKVRTIHNAKYQEELDVRARELKREQAYLDSLVNRMSELGEEYGLVDITSQVEGMFTDVSAGKFYNAEGIATNRAIKNLGKHGPEFKKISEMMQPMLARYAQILTDYNNAYRELNKEITYSNIVTHPFVADKKFWPKRSVIVLMSVFLTLIMALIVIGVIENRSYFKSK